jgi:AcrR family transcriptional regulator
MNTRDEQKTRTRRAILDSARRLFARDGILATTSAGIAREAGISQGSVFAHFGTQEGLVAAVIEEFGDSVARRLHELAEAPGASSFGTRELLAAQLEAIGEEEDFYVRLVVEAPLLPPIARNSLLLIQSSIAFHLAPAIEADQAAGRVKAMPLDLLFNTWLGLLHRYLADRELFAPGGSLVKRLGARILDHFMSLIAT